MLYLGAPEDTVNIVIFSERLQPFVQDHRSQRLALASASQEFPYREWGGDRLGAVSLLYKLRHISVKLRVGHEEPDLALPAPVSFVQNYARWRKLLAVSESIILLVWPKGTVFDFYA